MSEASKQVIELAEITMEITTRLRALEDDHCKLRAEHYSLKAEVEALREVKH